MPDQRPRFLLLILLLAAALPAVAQEGIRHRLFLLGDGGTLPGEGAKTAQAVAALAGPDTNATVLLLGNNIYPSGLPDDEEKNHDRSVQLLEQQLAPFRPLGTRVYVLPGNRDWDNAGPDGLEKTARQARYTDSLHRPYAHFLPQDACPGPEEIELAPGIVLVIMDSQWWLHSFARTGETSDCPCKTEDEVLVRLEDIAYRHRNDHIIVAAHHPLRSHGIHGGFFRLKQHLFPLTDAVPAAYVPLPVIGSLYPLVRGAFGATQDLHHPAYRNMIASWEEAMRIAADVTFVGAHDHNLQLLKEKDRYYVVSGAAGSTDRVRKGHNSLFAREQAGFSELRYYSDGRRQHIFYALSANGQAQELYTETLPALRVQDPVDTIPPPLPFTRIMTAAVAPQYDSVGRLHRALFGENYRKVWATPVKMEVFRLSEEEGGLRILQKGGGMQTKSLRLKDSSGREWVLRTIQKEPSKALAPNLRRTIVRDVVQDEISMAHPYAPLTLPPMADAIGVPHANPRVVFVPADPDLGVYMDDFANSVCLFEEREPGIDPAKEKSYSTPKVLAKLEEDQDNVIDQRAVVRARLFDLVIGDWDRHEDQWRWGKREQGDSNVYFPIPRDRDQTYYINTGLFPKIAARKWLIPKFQGFKEQVPYVEGFMFNGRYFDRFFLHGLEEQDWVDAAHYIQAQLSDSIIESSVHLLPDSVFALSGPGIIRKLKARRDGLEQEARTYYRFLSRTVEIPGTDKTDYFHIEHLRDGRLRVSLTKIQKDGGLEKQPYYRRSFEPGITRELRLYGRGGRDVFSVTGADRSPIRVRLIGGNAADSFFVQPDLHNRRRTLIYDRADQPNSYPDRSLYLSRISKHKDVNTYDGRTFRYNKLMPTGTVRFNPDDGILLGIGAHYTTHGFRKEPYSTDQQLIIGHSLATNASFLRYNGDFRKLIGRNDLNIVLDAFAPDNTRNFFGIGNETLFLKKEEGIRYYRSRYNVINALLRIKKPLGEHLKLYAGVLGQFYKMDREDNEGRFIEGYEPLLSGQDIFSSKFFGGLSAGFELDTRNNTFNPSRGILWNTSLTGVQEAGGNNSCGQVLSTATVYASLRNNPNLILINRLGFGSNFGQPLFFQLQYLGGGQNLRGYRTYRFAGHQMLYHNIEARVKLFDFASYLFPGSVGVTAFNDIGRVWARGEASGRWHDGYGGGLYIIPAETVYFGFTVSHSPDGALPYFTFNVNL